MDIFHAYDIRGIYPEELNETKVYNIAKAYAKLIKEETPNKNKYVFVVGRDMRLSSPALAESVIKGLTAVGADVIDIGLASTPTFYFAVSYLKADGGLQVSASHNPKEYNGIKAVRTKAYPIGLPNGLDRIRDYSLATIPETPRPGKVTTASVLKKRIQYALSFMDYQIKPMKIIADVANAMGSLDLEALFSHLPHELIKMNFTLDGTFPAHQADPFVKSNIKDLEIREVKEHGDLGIATDGDADRIFFIDSDGKLIEPAIIRGIIAQVILRTHPGAKICYDIRPGRITKDLIEEAGGIPIVTKVGHSLIKEHAIRIGAPFAGESSGHFFIQTDYGFFETPLIVALILMSEISKSGLTSADYIKPYRKYFHSGERNFKVKYPQAVMDRVEKQFKDNSNVTHIDGISIESDHFWFNIRPSNTEPLLRLNLEATSSSVLDRTLKDLTDLITNT